MEKIDLVLYILSGGFALMLVMWHSINNRIDKLDEKLTDIDRRLGLLGCHLHLHE